MSLEEKLVDYFGGPNVSLLHDHLYKCVKKDKGDRPYQIFFIDSSEGWLKRAEPFLDQHAIDQFYEEPGSLQWNYYYYYIADAKALRKHGEQKRVVEQNLDYARKTVTSSAELLSLLAAMADIKAPAVTAPSIDLYTLWIAYLKETGFSFVFNTQSAENYARRVEAYVDGNSDTTQIDFKLEQPSPKGDKFGVRELQIHHYRSYPSVNHYKFGRVNLIHGPNAAGKTSLLDCFELVFTGANFQKPEGQGYVLELTDSKDHTYHFPEASETYQTRDREWYDNWLTGGNNLNGNFNKFNYFNSDAAFKLKLDDDLRKNDLMQVMTEITLGKEINILEEQVEAFRKLFEDTFQLLLNDSKRLNDELVGKNDLLEELRSKKADMAPLEANLRKKLIEYGWLLTFSSSDNNSLLKFEETLGELQLCFEKVKDWGYSIPYASQNTVLSELNRLKQAENKLVNLHDEQSAVQKRVAALENILHEQELIHEYLTELGNYVNHPNFSQFVTLSASIKNETNELDRARLISEAKVDIINIEDFYEDRAAHIPSVIRKYHQTITSCKDRITLLNHSIADFEKNLTQLEKVTSEIQSLSKVFVESKSYDGYCPTCRTPFEKDQLIEQIIGAKLNLENSALMVSIRAEKRTLLSQQEDTEEKLKKIRVLEKQALLLFGEKYEDKALEEVLLAVKAKEASVAEGVSRLLSLNTLQAQFYAAGLSISRYHFLIEKLAAFFPRKMEITKDYANCIRDFNEALLKSSRSYREECDHLDAVKSSIQNLLGGRIKDEQDLAKSIYTLQGMLNDFKKIGFFIDLINDPDINVLEERYRPVKTAFLAYKKELDSTRDNHETIKLVNQQIHHLLVEIKQIVEKRDRSRHAVEVLKEVSVKYNKYTYLRNYLESNKKDVVNIFRLIHAPREFNDIEFVDERLELKTKDGSKTLNQISTGQRSALALSVFLGLNKKLTSGPNVILLDDPLAYMDDLNVLSFFDYLRELVVESDKQIFFATANDDIAYLFKKKFEFLGPEDFKEVKLNRVD